MKGTVKSYSPATQYGFIVNDEGEMFFFLKTEWHFVAKPKPNMRVEFTPVEHEKGMRATNINRERKEK